MKFLLPSILSKYFVYFYRYYLQKSFSSNSLDLKMQKYLVKDNGFFIEIGANNGIDQSNTFLLEIKKNWRGVLVEPSLNKFFDCVNIRSKNNHFFCNACVSFDYKEMFVPMVYADLMSVSKGLETDLVDINEHLRKSVDLYLNKNEQQIEYGARAKTLTKILQEAKAPRDIDFFSLDVEGSEINVLKGLDFEEFKIKYILVECRDFEKMENFLNSKKYTLLEKMTFHDYLFCLNE
jgi:FkbM family methyltransferase